MYACSNLYATTAYNLDATDQQVFQQALDLATLKIDPTNIKPDNPIAICSKLKGYPKTTTDVPRKTAHDKTIAQRSFISLDLDYNTGEETKAETTRQNIIQFAQTNKTPLLIYPTLSYPTKPRYRAILFTKRVLSDTMYRKAVTYLKKTFDIGSGFDIADMRMYSNLGLPFFSNHEQAAEVYNTIGQEGLEPLGNDLWKNTSIPKKAKNKILKEYGAHFYQVTFDTDRLVEGAKIMAQSGFVSDYTDWWKVLTSIVAAHKLGQLSLDDCYRVLDTLAMFGTDDGALREAWRVDNRVRFEGEIDRWSGLDSKVVRPLGSYFEFRDAVVGVVGGVGGLLEP